MGLAHSPRIVTNGLVLSFDAGNSGKSYKPDNNLLDVSTWYVGANSTTGVTGFGFNETDSGENTLIQDTDPFGNAAVIWKAYSPDGVNDGGWNSTYVDIDHTKLYRFSVWINRKVTGTDGRFYFGLQGYNSSNSNTGVIYRINGTNSTNPYSYFSSEPPTNAELPQDEWKLIVFHVWPSGSGTGSAKSDTGIWNANGTKRDVTTPNAPYDFVWNTTTAKTVHRTYLFYSEGDSSVIQHWCYPRIDLVDGTEPSISDLINNRTNSLYWYDISGNGNSKSLINGVSYSSSNQGFLTYDGVNDYLDFFAPNLGDTVTVEMWCKIKSLSGMMFGWNRYDVYIPSGRLGYNTSASDLYGISSSDVTNLGLLNNWKHYVFEMRSNISYTNNKIYINGVELSLSQQLASESSTYRTFNSGNGRISGWLFSDSYRLNMDLATFKVYNRALTPSEVQQNFNALRGRFSI